MNDSFENRIEERSLTLFEMTVTVIPSVRICENSRFFLRYGSAAPCLLRMIGRADFPSSAKRVSRETRPATSAVPTQYGGDEKPFRRISFSLGEPKAMKQFVLK